MADPGWGTWGNCPSPLSSPFGGTILLIKILNFMSGLDQLTHENDMQILVAFITNSPEIKANQSEISCEIAPSTFVHTKRL